MICSEKNCLASLAWFGAPDDTALAEFAKNRGWRVHEGAGWVCPHHHLEAAGGEHNHIPDVGKKVSAGGEHG